MLSRFLRYAEHQYDLKHELAKIHDRRKQGVLPAFGVVAGLFFMAITQTGSLNGIEEALGKCPAPCRWHTWLDGKLPSADRLGQVAALIEPDQLRALLARHYRKRRRKKTLRPFRGKWFILILDGHECFASHHRRCKDCLERTVKVKGEERTQYYHRFVLAYLMGEDGRVLLDLEMQRRGEGEIAAARRLLKRVLAAYPRAFNVVSGDALYLDPALCQDIRAAGNHFIVVLKNANRTLIQDFDSLKDQAPAIQMQYHKRHCVCRDIEGFTSWDSLGEAVRVVCSEEQWTVRRQRTKEHEPGESTWLWVTSLSQAEMDTVTLAQLGHRRWDIENHAFNELDKYWHADHMYHHDITAMTVILLILLLAYNLFHVWHARGLKSALRDRYTIQFFARQIRSQFFSALKIGSG
jgi:hypothetical protein